jgi:hypothetical protein
LQSPHPALGGNYPGNDVARRRGGGRARTRSNRDGAIKTITGLPWVKGSTVLDVMNAAKERPHGISFSHTGSGASAFLTRIDDVANEGGSGAKKNWQLWVNTSYAERSFGVYELQPLDVVFWRFATQAGK